MEKTRSVKLEILTGCPSRDNKVSNETDEFGALGKRKLAIISISVAVEVRKVDELVQSDSTEQTSEVLGQAKLANRPRAWKSIRSPGGTACEPKGYSK